MVQAIPLSPDLQKLADLMGVESDYVDGRNQHQAVPPDAICRILEAMGCAVSNNHEIHHSLEQVQQKSWHQVLEPVLLYFPQEKQPFRFDLNLPIDPKDLKSCLVHVELRDEEGKIRSCQVKGSSCRVVGRMTVQDQLFMRLNLSLPRRLPYGYFDLTLKIDGRPQVPETQSLVISAPKRCFVPKTPKKVWGLGIQLYSLRSKNNWGIGDFRDLKHIIKTVGKKWGVSTIGLSPLHCVASGLHSPYSPSSRLFWNVLYLNLEEISEFRKTEKILKKFGSKKFQERLQRLRNEPLVNYPEIASIKSTYLESLFRVFQREHLRHGTRRAGAFSKFVRNHAPSLTRFCTFQALCERFESSAWREWPSEFHTPESPAVLKFQKLQTKRIQYFQYVQWQCELQLQALDRLTKGSSMSLRLYQDLPIGIHPDGADAWVYQEQLVPSVTVGAPPDAFNLQGQNWGLQTSNPQILRQKGYQFFRETLRQNMRHGGVLRIDHALGLFRKFLISQGGTGSDGVYVRMFVDEVLAVLALESHRHRVMVVGEDLGTVTPLIRQKLENAGLLSYRLLVFERKSDGHFQSPAAYPSQALVAAITHDLPTLCGFWVGRDMEMKEQAGLYPGQADIDRDWGNRAEDRLRLWAALQQEGLCSGESLPLTLTLPPIQAVYQFLARSPSRLLIVQLEDLLTQLDTPNLPAAKPEDYPSWRVKTATNIHEWLQDPALRQFARRVSEDRRRPHQPSRQNLKSKTLLCSV